MNIDSASARAFIRAGKEDMSTIPYRPQVKVSGYHLFVLSVQDEVLGGSIVQKMQRMAAMWAELEAVDKDFYNTVASKLKNQRFHVDNLQRKVAARRIQRAWRELVFKVRSDAAKRIQQAWRDAWYNPDRSLCRARLCRELSELNA